MERRTMLGMLGAGAVGAALIGKNALAADDAHAHPHDKVHEDCLKACSDCAKSCDEAFHHCYTMVAQGKKEHAKPLHMVSDCAGFCDLSASMIARHSPLMVDSCHACASACKKTLAIVEKFDSPEMKMAAEKLTACVKSCTEMVEAMGGHEGHNHADHDKK